MSESISIPAKQFVNWYEVLGVQPTAKTDDLARVFQLLSARFKPDNKETGDGRRLQELKTAYDVLSNPERRKAFDQELKQRTKESGPLFQSKEFADEVDSEINRRLEILCLLYKQRKSDPIYPGLTVAQLESLLLTPREHLEFAFWYLKQRKLVLADDRSLFTINCDGIAYIEENLPRESRKLMKPERAA